MTLPALSAYCLSYSLSRIADQGLANFFGLATLRHGTHPLSWLSIHITGALPQLGGNSTGGDYGSRFAAQNRGNFFLARGIRNYPLGQFGKRLSPRLIPRSYTFSATTNFLKNLNCPKIIAAPTALLTAAILPPIRFRTSQDQVERMARDPSMPFTACSTSNWISPLNIGIVGTAWNSLTFGTPLRMVQEPWRVLTGIAQLALAGGAAYYAFYNMPSYLVAHRTALIAGAVLGLL